MSGRDVCLRLYKAHHYATLEIMLRSVRLSVYRSLYYAMPSQTGAFLAFYGYRPMVFWHALRV